MKEVRLAFVGFGNVAQGVTKILLDQQAELEKNYGVRFYITAITDRGLGNVFDPDGISPAELIAAMERPQGLNSVPGSHPDWDPMEMIQGSPADVLVEMSNTDLTTAEPATSYIAEALRRKKHVVTTNKGPIALYYETLNAIARLHGVQIGVEGTVMSGTPVLRVGRELLSAAGIRRIEGILNGTSNYILSQMEEGATYAAALQEAQSMGFAEADPTADVDGMDAAAKVAILSRLVLDTTIPLAAVEREGITGISPELIEKARAEGKHWRLLGVLEKDGSQVNASVRPVCLDSSHPLARIHGVTNAITFSTLYLGAVTITGPGAGRTQTGYAVIQDLLNIYHAERNC